MSDDVPEWCLIESDPGVITALLQGFGVTGLEAEELYTLDDEIAPSIADSYAFIFLFKWSTEDAQRRSQNVTDDQTILFAKQEVRNACASQAILNILFNIDTEANTRNKVVLGETITNLCEFIGGLDPKTRGEVVANCDTIRAVHNSFANPTLFEMGKIKEDPKDVPYHFVAYLPIRGRLYELDGLQSGPIDHGEVTKENWINRFLEIMRQRLEMEPAAQYNVISLTADKIQLCDQRISELTALAEAGDNSAQREIEKCKREKEDELVQRKRNDVENKRRQHNYLPLIMGAMMGMARANTLGSSMREAIAAASNNSNNSA